MCDVKENREEKWPCEILRARPMHASFPLKSTDTMTDVWPDALAKTLANAVSDSLLLPLLE